MPFSLKNAGAAYQCATSIIFRDPLREMMECYVDDIAVKTQNKDNHLHDLRMEFDIMRAHQLKMNLTKLFLGVSRGKFLGLIITSKVIHLDPDKAKAIQSIQPPKTLKELRGRLAYIRKFIVNPSGRYQSFIRLMKKGVSFVWDDACQKAFEDIKEYLTKPPVLVSPISEKSLLFYVRAMDHSPGALLAQKNNKGAEETIYYHSRTLIGAENHYNPVEKECLAIVLPFKIRHYLVGQTIHVISRVDSLRILMTNPGSLNSRLANWAILLSQYDMISVPQKATKDQALADFLAAHPVLETLKLHEDILDEIVEANMTFEDEV